MKKNAIQTYGMVLIVVIHISTGCKQVQKVETGEKNVSSKVEADSKDQAKVKKQAKSKKEKKKGKEYIEEKKNLGKNSKDQGKEEKSVYTGEYNIKVTMFTGKLIIKKNDGVHSGTIMFNGWGKGVAQPVKDLKFNGKKIYFVRSILTSEELVKYGGQRYFKQKYFGEYSKDWKKIKGYFIDSGAEISWYAVKVK